MKTFTERASPQLRSGLTAKSVALNSIPVAECRLKRAEKRFVTGYEAPVIKLVAKLKETLANISWLLAAVDEALRR